MPTALELTREEWQPYLEAARQRLTTSKSSEVNQPERDQLLVHVRQASAMLKSRFGARRVILFGSLVDAASFTPDSDVDLAVEGLVPEAYWSAWRAIEDIIDDRPVDLIEIETARKSLLKAIEQYGIEL